MSISSVLTVSVQSRNNRDLPPTKGTLTRIDWEKTDRPKNAIKFFGMGLAATFAGAMIPLLHWILVPCLFIATFVMSIEKFRESHRNAGGSAQCPKCHQTFVIEKSKWNERLTDTCGNCHDDLEIHVQSELPAHSSSN